MSWSFLRRFHKPSRCVLTPTPSIANELTARGFPNTRSWTRGVDHTLFKPGPRDHFDLPRPIMLAAGRVAPEKNLEAFLKLDLPGTKVIVGDGPSLELLKRRYPQALFTGYAFDHDLVRMLQGGRRLRLPEPHRHVRPGHDRGHGLRHAGCRLRGAKPGRRRG